MDSKNILASKSVWAAILTPIFAWLATKGFDTDPELQAAIIGLCCAVSAILLRKVTKGPVHIVKSKE